MKVYFTAAINQRERFKREYSAILQTITRLGHEALTSFDVMDKSLEQALHANPEDLERFFLHWRKIIAKVNAAVVEVSFPSTVNIGMEIGALLERGKPTICLYRSGADPVFTSELHSSRLVKAEYSVENIRDVLEWGFGEVEQMIRRRFTFFISPELDAHLTHILKKKGTSRSEYIRTLIRKDAKQQKKKT